MVATAALLLKDIEGKEKYLTAFASGNLDFFKREKSFAKDLLWEVEVWAQLYRKISKTRRLELPVRSFIPRNMFKTFYLRRCTQSQIRLSLAWSR